MARVIRLFVTFGQLTVCVFPLWKNVDVLSMRNTVSIVLFCFSLRLLL